MYFMWSNATSILKTRISGLLYNIVYRILSSAVLVQYQYVTEGWTHDNSIYRASIALLGKNHICKACSNLEGDLRTLEVPLFDRSVVTTTIWHRFRDITTFTVYVTGCYVKKALIFKKLVEITSQLCFLIHL